MKAFACRLRAWRIKGGEDEDGSAISGFDGFAFDSDEERGLVLLNDKKTIIIVSASEWYLIGRW
jgi:hypothetical protein